MVSFWSTGGWDFDLWILREHNSAHNTSQGTNAPSEHKVGISPRIMQGSLPGKLKRTVCVSGRHQAPSTVQGCFCLDSVPYFITHSRMIDMSPFWKGCWWLKLNGWHLIGWGKETVSGEASVWSVVISVIIILIWKSFEPKRYVKKMKW